MPNSNNFLINSCSKKSKTHLKPYCYMICLNLNKCSQKNKDIELNDLQILKEASINELEIKYQINKCILKEKLSELSQLLDNKNIKKLKIKIIRDFFMPSDSSYLKLFSQLHSLANLIIKNKTIIKIDFNFCLTSEIKLNFVQSLAYEYFLEAISDRLNIFRLANYLKSEYQDFDEITLKFFNKTKSIRFIEIDRKYLFNGILNSCMKVDTLKYDCIEDGVLNINQASNNFPEIKNLYISLYNDDYDKHMISLIKNSFLLKLERLNISFLEKKINSDYDTDIIHEILNLSNNSLSILKSVVINITSFKFDLIYKKLFSNNKNQYDFEKIPKILLETEFAVTEAKVNSRKVLFDRIDIHNSIYYIALDSFKSFNNEFRMFLNTLICSYNAYKVGLDKDEKLENSLFIDYDVKNYTMFENQINQIYEDYKFCSEFKRKKLSQFIIEINEVKSELYILLFNVLELLLKLNIEIECLKISGLTAKKITKSLERISINFCSIKIKKIDIILIKEDQPLDAIQSFQSMSNIIDGRIEVNCNDFSEHDLEETLLFTKSTNSNFLNICYKEIDIEFSTLSSILDFTNKIESIYITKEQDLRSYNLAFNFYFKTKADLYADFFTVIKKYEDSLVSYHNFEFKQYTKNRLILIHYIDNALEVLMTGLKSTNITSILKNNFINNYSLIRKSRKTFIIKHKF